MNILFITKHFYPESGATSNILYHLSTYLINKGNNVVVLGTQSENEKVELSKINYNNIKIFRIYNNSSNQKKMLFEAVRKRQIRLFIRIMILLINRLFIKSERIKVNNKVLLKSLENVIRSEKIDVVISVCDPFSMIYLGYLAKKKWGVKWIMYMIDPYFNNFKNIKYLKRRIKTEKKMLELTDTAIVTDLIYKDYRNSELKDYIYKTKKLSFPNIRNINNTDGKGNISFNKDDINCVFVGYLYPDIRNPEYLFNLLKEVDNSRIKLHIIGGIYGKFNDGFLKSYKETLGDRLIFHGKVDSTTAFNAMINADILINIGNTVRNQMPSKIFDYISTGKPIVNLCKIEDCPTLEYTKKYPVCLDLFESSGLTDSVKKQFERFCIEKSNVKIDFSIIKEIYYDNTLEVVCEEFLDILNEVVVK